MKLLVAVLFSLSLSLALNAQDLPTEDGPNHALTLTGGTSPFRDLPKPTDRTFVRDDQPGVLDTVCSTQSQGPLRITIPIDRVITKVDRAQNPSGYDNVITSLVNRVYLSGKVKIKMPVKDVDAPYEVDKVYLNDHPIGTLYGSDGTWKINEFEADIHWLNFGKYTDVNSPSIASNNEIRIDINTTNDFVNNWCTAVDWVSVSFESMSPVVMIHGNNSDGKFFEREGLTTVFDNQDLLYDNSLNLVPASSYIEDPILDEQGNVIDQPNNFKINEHLKKVAKAFGVDSLHLVMHSKGGLDARSYLALYQPSNNKLFKILSYTSLATPHNGSILADIVVQRAAAVKRASYIQYDENFPWLSRQAFSISPPSLGHYNLTTDYLRGFNQRNIGKLSPTETQFNVTAADADKDGNGAISLSTPFFTAREDEGLVREGFLDFYSGNLPLSFPAPAVPTVMYRTIRDIQAVRVEITTGILGPLYHVGRFISTRTDTAQYNDTLVSKDSGFGVGTFDSVVNQSSGHKSFYQGPADEGFPNTSGGANHATIARRSALDVVDWIWRADLAKGDWNR